MPRLDCGTLKYHVSICYYCSKRGEHAVGLRLLYKALDLDSLSLDALLSLSAALMNLGNFTEAEDYLRKAEQMKPYNTNVYTHYGTLKEKKGASK